jgi:hypothetical protein
VLALAAAGSVLEFGCALSSRNFRKIRHRKTTATTSDSRYAKPLKHSRQMAGKIRFLMALTPQSLGVSEKVQWRTPQELFFTEDVPENFASTDDLQWKSPSIQCSATNSYGVSLRWTKRC